MISFKFTNVKFYTGGSKIPKRIRHNQNYTLCVWKSDLVRYTLTEEEILAFSDQQLKELLILLTRNTVLPSNTTKVIKN